VVSSAVEPVSDPRHGSRRTGSRIVLIVVGVAAFAATYAIVQSCNIHRHVVGLSTRKGAQATNIHTVSSFTMSGGALCLEWIWDIRGVPSRDHLFTTTSWLGLGRTEIQRRGIE
jgi:hypothetical protein